MKRAAILWTGGKDSVLAWELVRERLDVRFLVTFVPDPPRPFLAHPLELIEAQAAAVGIEHRALAVGAPFKEGYEQAIAELADDGIEVLVTGDMDRVAGHDNWIVERSVGLVEVERPLWQAERADVLRRLVDERWRVVIMLATHDAFPDGGMAGRALDAELADEWLARAAGDATFDACGENGEYHTATLWAPGFTHGLELDGVDVSRSEQFEHVTFARVRPA